MQTLVNKTVAILKNGGVILYPSDTVWGLACDATNTLAVEKLFTVKKRAFDKPILIQVLDEEMLDNYARITIAIDSVKKKYPNDPITIIYPYLEGLSPLVVAADNTVAARIVQDGFTQQVLQQLGKPIASTSANISGNLMPNCFAEITNSIQNKVDHIVPLKQDELMRNTSKIIKIEGNKIIVIR